MPYVNWVTRTLYIDQSELTEVTAGTLYEMDTDWLWTTIHDIQDNDDGMINPDIMFNNQPYTMSGVPYSRAVEIINGFVIQFTGPASPNDHYSVRLTGGNNNVADVFIPNPVSVISNNSAGFAQAAGARAVWQYQIEPNYSAEEEMRIQSSSAAAKLSGAGTANVKIRDLNDTKDRIDADVDDVGNRDAVTIDGS